MNDSHADHDDRDPTGLIALLDDLLATGAQHPKDLLNGAKGLVTRLAPGEPGTVYHRARRAHRVLIASIDALGRPRSDALRALYNLDPIPRGKKPPFTLTERREKAAEIYHLSAETIRRHTEDDLLEALAMEIDYRISRGEGSTWLSTYLHFKLPHQLPPPPIEFYRLARERHIRNQPRTVRDNRRPWTPNQADS